jgi:hypothetical protein
MSVDSPFEFGELFDDEMSMTQVCRLQHKGNTDLYLRPKIFTQTEPTTFSMTFNFARIEDELRKETTQCFQLVCSTKNSLLMSGEELFRPLQLQTDFCVDLER